MSVSSRRRLNAACTSFTPSGWYPSSGAADQNRLLDVETNEKASGGESDEAMRSRISACISHIDVVVLDGAWLRRLGIAVTMGVTRCEGTTPHWKDNNSRKKGKI